MQTSKLTCIDLYDSLQCTIWGLYRLYSEAESVLWYFCDVISQCASIEGKKDSKGGQLASATYFKPICHDACPSNAALLTTVSTKKEKSDRSHIRFRTNSTMGRCWRIKRWKRHFHSHFPSLLWSLRSFQEAAIPSTKRLIYLSFVRSFISCSQPCLISTSSRNVRGLAVLICTRNGSICRYAHRLTTSHSRRATIESCCACDEPTGWSLTAYNQGQSLYYVYRSMVTNLRVATHRWNPAETSHKPKRFTGSTGTPLFLPQGSRTGRQGHRFRSMEDYMASIRSRVGEVAHPEAAGCANPNFGSS